MRFSVRDMLLLTLQLAFVFGLFRILTDDIPADRVAREWISGAGFAAFWFCFMWLFSPRKPRRDLAKTLARLPNERYAWQTVLMCIVFIIFASLLSLFPPVSNNPGMFLMFVGVVLRHWLLGREIEINEQGVESNNGFRPWKDPAIQLSTDGDSNVLLVSNNGVMEDLASRAKLTPELAAHIKQLIATQRGA